MARKWNNFGVMFFSFRRKYRKLAVVFCLTVTFYVLHEFSAKEIPLEDSGNKKIERKSAEYEYRGRCQAYKVHQQICQDYFANRIGGNLCADLCIKKSMWFEPFCNSVKPTTIILFGKWKDKDIVLKTKASSHKFQDLDNELSYVYQIKDPSRHSQYQQHFTNHIYEYIIQELSVDYLYNKITPVEMLQRMYHPHLKKTISLVDMRSLWALLQQEEYTKLQLLQGSKHVPQVYGFCGRYYAMERVKSLGDFVQILSIPLPWPKRVGIALDLLDTINELKSMFIGPLSHCDVQPGNFGLGQDGKVVVLDFDTVFTQPQMDQYMAQGNCTSNSDCSFFDCISKCIAGKCSRNIVTNNLHLVCRDLLVPGLGQLRLLRMTSAKTPTEVQLQSYLIQCTDSSKLPWSKEKKHELFKHIHNLLTEINQKYDESMKNEKDYY